MNETTTNNPIPTEFTEDNVGNKANKVGRPLKFKSVEELQSKIEAYFKETPKEEWTITGLALALDTFRSVLCDYEDKDEFAYTIKRAKQIIENGYEIDLKKYGRTGTIFALKNFDWKDKSEQDITSGGEKINKVLVEFIDGNNDSNTEGIQETV